MSIDFVGVDPFCWTAQSLPPQVTALCLRDTDISANPHGFSLLLSALTHPCLVDVRNCNIFAEKQTARAVANFLSSAEGKVDLSWNAFGDYEALIKNAVRGNKKISVVMEGCSSAIPDPIRDDTAGKIRVSLLSMRLVHEEVWDLMHWIDNIRDEICVRQKLALKPSTESNTWQNLKPAD